MGFEVTVHGSTQLGQRLSAIDQGTDASVGRCFNAITHAP